MGSSPPIRATSRPASGRRGGTPPPARQLREIFCATRDSESGLIYLKVVNCSGSARPIKAQLSGVKSINPRGEAVVLAADSLEATNSIGETNKVVPRTENVNGLGTDFTREFPAYSVTVLKLRAE